MPFPLHVLNPAISALVYPGNLAVQSLFFFLLTISQFRVGCFYGMPLRLGKCQVAVTISLRFSSHFPLLRLLVEVWIHSGMCKFVFGCKLAEICASKLTAIVSGYFLPIWQ